MRTILSLVFLFSCLFSFAQKANVNWGEDFKMKKGSTDLSIVHADKDGIYLKEGHSAIKSYFVVGTTTRESATLVKLDNSFSEIYRNDFNKELKGKDFEDFYFLQNKMFLLATHYDKSDDKLTLLAAEVNKADGSLTGDWKELDGWYKESKNDDINFKVDYNADSSHMIVVSTLEGRSKEGYRIVEFDSKLKALTKPVNITHEFERNTFRLEDIIYASNGNIAMVGRVYEYQEGKKKKSKFLDFKNYLIRIYNPTGKLIKELNTTIDAKWLMSTRLMQVKGNEMVLAAFYSNTKKGKEVNGMLVQRINPANGEVISTSQKELNTSLISVLEDNDEDNQETKAERKERERLEKMKEEEDGFSKYYRFRNFIPTTDGGLAILAEDYYYYTYSIYTSGTTMGNMSTSGSYTTYRSYSCGNIMMGKMDASGNLSWLQILPKSQEETMRVGSGQSATGFGGWNYYFGKEYGRPYYAGFISMPIKNSNKIAIVFNDLKKNAAVTKLGQKVKRIYYFDKSDCYQVTVDMSTGTYDREFIFSNSGMPTSMPRLGVNLGSDLYLVGRQERFMAKSKIAVGKISF